MTSGTKNFEETFAAIAITILLIFTAWGNATGMLIPSVIGIAIGLPGLLMVKRSMLRSLIFVAIISLAIAASIALALALG